MGYRLTSLLSKGLQISAVRLMKKSSQSHDGSWSKRPLPLWVISHSLASKPALRQLSGLFHFRVRFEDLHSKDVILRRFRSQKFGHKADFLNVTNAIPVRSFMTVVIVRPLLLLLTNVPTVPALAVNVFKLLFVTNLLLVLLLLF